MVHRLQDLMGQGGQYLLHLTHLYSFQDGYSPKLACICPSPEAVLVLMKETYPGAVPGIQFIMAQKAWGQVH